MSKQDQDIIEKALSAAKQAGADGADVSFIKGGGLDVQVRLGKVESAERAEDYQMGMRVFVGQKSATISSGQLDDENITELAERAVAMAKHARKTPMPGWPQLKSRRNPSPILSCLTTPASAQKS